MVGNMNRTFDNRGHLIDEQAYSFEPPPWTFGNLADSATPSAPAIAEFLGVPVTWVLVAGIGLIVVAYFCRR